METEKIIKEESETKSGNKRKPGPKPKGEDDKLDFVVRMRLNKKQIDYLVEELDPLKKINVNIADLIRHKLFPKNASKIKRIIKELSQGAKDPNQEIVDMTKAIEATKKEIKRIGVNINQVVHKINGIDYAPSLRTCWGIEKAW